LVCAQDAFIRDHITRDDVLIVSVGGNDIALSPTLRTAVNMLLVTSSPCWLIRAGWAPGLGYVSYAKGVSESSATQCLNPVARV
jgi:hypothetical protein